MATFKYIIRPNRLNKKRQTTIYLTYCHDSKTKLISTGEKIGPKYWNAEKERAKSNYPHYEMLMDILTKFKLKGTQIVKKSKSNGVDPTIEYVRKELVEEAKAKEAGKVKVYDFFEKYDEFLDYSAIKKTKGTVKNYRTVLKHLKGFAKKKRFKFTFEKIDFKFYQRFLKYLLETANLSNNSADNQIKLLKAFLNWTTVNQYNTNLAFKNFPRSYEEVDFVYLTEAELFQIKNCDLSQFKAKDYGLVRDVFCFCCFTGLRYSDIKQLKKRDIIDKDYILIKMQKTRRSVRIPLNQYAKSILEKYDDSNNQDNCFRVYENAVMNRYLKEIGELSGIDSKETLTTFSGGNKREQTEPKYKFITFHTARRTFITLSLQKGMRQEVVMKIVGHKDVRTMMKYVKLVDDVFHDEMDNAWG